MGAGSYHSVENFMNLWYKGIHHEIARLEIPVGCVLNKSFTDWGITCDCWCGLKWFVWILTILVLGNCKLETFTDGVAMLLNEGNRDWDGFSKYCYFIFLSDVSVHLRSSSGTQYGTVFCCLVLLCTVPITVSNTIWHILGLELDHWNRLTPWHLKIDDHQMITKNLF